MKYVDEYRNNEQVQALLRAIRKVTTRPWHIMEICGGQTHAIARYRLEEMLPQEIRLLHGPGCPVCVTPVSLIDQALELAGQSDIILASFGDMMRVPGTKEDLLQAKAHGADVRMLYSPLDAIELAYSGAQIIHPKTVKPLQNRNIPLYVRPFGDKRKPGTVIRGMSAPVEVPILILKKDQVLLTIRSRDLSFVLEEKFGTIFSLLERYRIKANLIHNSAVNLSLCVDNTWHIDDAVSALRDAGFDVLKAADMELLTIRGYDEAIYMRYAQIGPKVFIRQTTQSTVRLVRKRE